MKKIVTAGDRVYLKFFDMDFFHQKAKEAGAQLIAFKGFDEEKFKELLGDADAVIVIDRKLSKEHIDAMKRCKIILALEVGYDFIDVKYATKKGIIVSNVPTYCTDEVAVHAFSLLLSVNRKIKTLINETSKGGWNYNVGKPMFEVSGKTLGIIGLGRIGRRVIPKARGFDIEVVAYDPYLSDDIFELLGVTRYYDLDDLLKVSDFVTLHIPLTGETYHMFGEKEFKIMKKDAILINASRGKVVDEKALYNACINAEIAGAGLDVLENEPPDKDNPILNCKNIIVTPHVAWYTENSIEKLRNQGMDEVIRVLNGKRPWYIVNSELFSK